MPIRIQTVLSDAWALFRQGRDWMLAVAGLFLFLPTLALALFVPRWPVAPAGEGVGRDERMLAWAASVTDWVAANGVWYVLAYAVTTFGTATIYAGLLNREAGDVREALRRAGMLLPRYLLATILVAIPTGAGLFLWLLPGLYIMGRTMLTGPALIAEQPLGAGTAVARSFSLSSGAGLPLMALASLVLLGGFVLAQPFAGTGSGPADGGLVGALLAVGLAAVSAATSLAQALVAASAYRRLVVR